MITRVGHGSRVAGVRRIVSRGHVSRRTVLPGRVGGREAHAWDGGGEALTHGDKRLHLVDPLTLAPLVLEPHLDHSLGQSSIFGQLFKNLWCGLGILIEAVL